MDGDSFDEFGRVIGKVRRLKSRRLEPHRPRPEPRPLQRQADEADVMADAIAGASHPAGFDGAEDMNWTAPGISRRLLRQLRRGQWKIQDQIDLHEMSVAAARTSVRFFLDEAIRRGYACVKIIHGKGLRSGPAGPRLRTATTGLLIHDKRVVAFTSAPPHDGGTGACYVLLRRRD